MLHLVTHFLDSQSAWRTHIDVLTQDVAGFVTICAARNNEIKEKCICIICFGISNFDYRVYKLGNAQPEVGDQVTQGVNTASIG